MDGCLVTLVAVLDESVSFTISGVPVFLGCCYLEARKAHVADARVRLLTFGTSLGGRLEGRSHLAAEVVLAYKERVVVSLGSFCWLTHLTWCDGLFR